MIKRGGYNKLKERRTCVVLVAIVLVMLVAFSRIYLAAHYLSDMLGAMAEGVASLVFCLTAVDTVRRRRQLLNIGTRG